MYVCTNYIHVRIRSVCMNVYLVYTYTYTQPMHARVLSIYMCSACIVVYVCYVLLMDVYAIMLDKTTSLNYSHPIRWTMCILGKRPRANRNSVK